MKRFQPGTGFTMFLIFFGIAVIEAIRSRNLLLILFWVSMALLFLIADNMKGQNQK